MIKSLIRHNSKLDRTFINTYKICLNIIFIMILIYEFLLQINIIIIFLLML